MEFFLAFCHALGTRLMPFSFSIGLFVGRAITIDLRRKKKGKKNKKTKVNPFRSGNPRGRADIHHSVAFILLTQVGPDRRISIGYDDQVKLHAYQLIVVISPCHHGCCVDNGINML
ncbi:uncharacterized protein BDW43DRAFT_235887 [Aspergillus alliaceus]|uniref:uncharacterized protein n=1 Tax=Petromyces alliaceus TaxID=209559 RepID=UPI0012A75FC1|nr:uncharacterized protein BDW43DRAFT_235887 [Aspergillus alliaceus]KAB8227868.1 hypothetical protein BDW43DRAFT_235887 [Aspergillus alliaceus]